MITMKTTTAPVTRERHPAVVPSTDLAARLSALIESAQQSDYLFGSSLGPFFDAQAEARYVPHFVYFGANSSVASLRLALFAGLGPDDLPASRALVAFIEGLVRRPDLGEGLNLSLFPVVNVAGLLGSGSRRDLTGEDWVASSAPEIALLSSDVRSRGYEGFVTVRTSPEAFPSARVRTTLSPAVARADVEVFSSEDFDGWWVEFESVAVGRVGRGPLSLAGALPFAPFEVELDLPARWTQAQADRVLAALLKRLIVRYRGVRAWGQYL